MEYHEKMKNKVWNFDSAEQPSPEINCASNPPTPIEFYSSDVANSHDLDEL